MNDLWNVYAWHDRGMAIRVGEKLPIEEALAYVEAYLKRGPEWDAYMVKIEDDPGYEIEA